MLIWGDFTAYFLHFFFFHSFPLGLKAVAVAMAGAP